MSYQTFKWKFVSRDPKFKFLIYAREREAAQAIIDIENIDNMYFLKPARFFFKKAATINVPPYDFEQHQLETARKRLEHRRKVLEENPDAVSWLAKH